MSNNNVIPGPQLQVEAPKKSPVQLVIIYDPNTGGVALNGPLNDGVLLMGMIEMAKAAYLENKLKPQNGLSIARNIPAPMVIKK